MALLVRMASTERPVLSVPSGDPPDEVLADLLRLLPDALLARALRRHRHEIRRERERLRIPPHPRGWSNRRRIAWRIVLRRVAQLRSWHDWRPLEPPAGMAGD